MLEYFTQEYGLKSRENYCRLRPSQYCSKGKCVATRFKILLKNIERNQERIIVVRDLHSTVAKGNMLQSLTKLDSGDILKLTCYVNRSKIKRS